jgi:thiol-disulfide isomerase/thioredoxin
MSDFILDHPMLVWRWSAPIFAVVVIACGVLLIFVTRRRSGWQRRVAQLACLLGLLAAAAGLLLRLGPLAPFVTTVGRLAQLQGSPMPPLALTSVSDGSPLDLRQLRGQVVVVNLWATWCPPCRAEMPDLVRLARTFPSNVSVVTVSDEDRALQQRFARSFGLPPQAAVGNIGWDTATFRPFTLIVDQEGTVREFYFGARDYAFFTQRVRAYL